MGDTITLRSSSEDDGTIKVVFNDVDTKWPVRIMGADTHFISLDNEEARHLLELLQQRYPLEGLAGA